jgi:CrcB protein
MPRADDQPRDHSEPVTAPAHIVDPDVDLHDPAQLAETRPREWDLLAAIAAGGVAGAEARYGVDVALPRAVGAFPWATGVVKVAGRMLIGVLMVVLLERARPHRLWRPFLGTGVLGGFTTYATFAVDTRQLITGHQAGLALGYVVLTFAACLTAVWLGVRVTRRITGLVRPVGQAAATAVR